MLNSDIEVIYRKPDSEMLYLKNKFYGTLLQISEPEYEIICYYAEHPNRESVCQYFESSYELPTDMLDQLLRRATDLNLLLTDEYARQRKRDEAVNQRRSRQLAYFVYYVNQVLARLHLSLLAKFKGNIHYFQLFTIQSTKKSIQQPLNHRLLLWMTLICISLFIISSITILNADSSQWEWQRVLNQSPGLRGIFLFILILSGIFVSTVLHEGAHYFLYKYYGGMTTEIGMALMIGIVPVVFVNTNSLYLWDSRKARMWVTGSGILMDVWQITLLVAIYVNTSLPGLLFLTAWLLIFVSIRFLTNINVFIPGTDGYFLYCDFWQKPDLYHQSLVRSREFWQYLRQGRFGYLTKSYWSPVAFISLSFISIAAYYLIFVALVLAPLFIQLFY